MSSALPAALSGYGVSLARLREEDIELVRQWRNHPEVARHMISQDPISPAQQLAWFRRVDAASDRACYLVRYDGEPTAFASVTATDGAALAAGDTLEAAIYLAPDSRCRGTMLAFAPALALNDACFDRLGCAGLVARVRTDNAPALRFNTLMGYRETGRDDRLVFMTLTADDYRAATVRLKDMLSRADARQRKTAR